MNSKLVVTAAALLALAGCVSPTPEGQTAELPEEVLALGAPGQDVSTARSEPDGCYWYLHRGPVESTYIPLLTREQRMICTVAQG
mgnify:CR=1 FL=1